MSDPTTLDRPQRLRNYQHALLNSERWNQFKARNNDIVIATSYKAGTTWMQGICAALVFQQPQPPLPQDKLTPWLDSNFAPVESVMELLESLQSRRYIKTHLPLDGLRFFDQVKYIYVGRDGRDIFMSMWNHWHNMNPESIAEVNNRPDRQGQELPLPPDDFAAAFDDWLTKGSFSWENNGYPFWSHLHHAKSWWQYRHLPNILMVHFDDLLADLDGQMRRISSYLDIAVDETIWPSLLDGVSFESMKANASKMAPGGTVNAWKDTADFFHRGTGKRWQSVLTDARVAAYETLALQELGPELADWLAKGSKI